MIPDCRNDENYNQSYLDVRDKEFIAGADWMLEAITNLFENNLDVYAGRLEVDTEVDVDKFLDKAKDELSEMIKDWAEMERNMMITSMIDSMDEDEYNQNVEANKSDEFYDTRK